MNITLLQAVLIGLTYYIANTSFLGGQAYFTTWRPLVNGTLVGFILGDPQEGMRIGAAINMLYLGYMSVGGTLGIGDAALAGILGAAVGIATGSAGIGILSGVALASLGYQLLVLRMRGANAIARRIDAAAARGDVGRMQFLHIAVAQSWLCLLTVPTAALLGWAAPTAARALLAIAPAPIMAGLAFGGALTPLLGLGLALKFVLAERTKLNLALFTAGAAATALGAPFEFLAAVSAAAVLTAILRAPHSPVPTQNSELGTFLRWQFFSHSNYSFEKLQGSGLGCTLAPNLRGDVQMLQRHGGFFNTEVNFGAMIPAILLRMEQRGADPADTIRTRQTLMSAIAGFGDEIVQGALLPALLSTAIGLALTARIGLLAVGAYVIGVATLMFGIAWKCFRAGLQNEKSAATWLLGHAQLRAAATAARSVTALAVGALAAEVAHNAPPQLNSATAAISAATITLGCYALLQHTRMRPLIPFLALVLLGMLLAFGNEPDLSRWW